MRKSQTESGTAGHPYVTVGRRHIQCIHRLLLRAVVKLRPSTALFGRSTAVGSSFFNFFSDCINRNYGDHHSQGYSTATPTPVPPVPPGPPRPPPHLRIPVCAHPPACGNHILNRRCGSYEQRHHQTIRRVLRQVVWRPCYEALHHGSCISDELRTNGGTAPPACLETMCRLHRLCIYQGGVNSTFMAVECRQDTST